MIIARAVGGVDHGLSTAPAVAPQPMDVVTRQCRYLLKGSILELLVAVPTHIVARARDYCCAGFWTFFGIAFGVSVMLFSFGPGVFFLFAARWKRLHPQRTGRWIDATCSPKGTISLAVGETHGPDPPTEILSTPKGSNPFRDQLGAQRSSTPSGLVTRRGHRFRGFHPRLMTLDLFEVPP